LPKFNPIQLSLIYKYKINNNKSDNVIKFGYQLKHGSAEA